MSAQFTTATYEFAHGKKPRGTGCWAFVVHAASGKPGDVRMVFTPGSMSFTEAKRWVRQQHPRAVRFEVGS